ncbi:MAG: hypothetical protein L0Y72_16220 [Gemmataceae bacterium]|nr:hypothetical protein [Gemmataceae bacterium]MCI0740594.1 hypothetical protein [Gemmataceae bacterium]
MHRRGPMVGLGILMCLILVGCSGGTGNTVFGKVTYLGKTLTTGVITFHASDGKTYGGGISWDGSYKLIGVPSGPAKVTIEVRNLEAPGTEGAAPPAGVNPVAGAAAPPIPVFIDEKYKSLNPDNRLQFDVGGPKGPDHKIDIDLQ